MKICPQCQEIYQDDSEFCPFDGVRLSTPTDPWVGRILDNRYQLLRKAGEGGMGTVYKAVQFHPKRPVAVKILPRDCLRDPTMKERFTREGMAAAMIMHEHIVKIYDAGETEEGLPYLVMEFLSGRSLAEEIHLGPLKPERVAAILIQVCEALGPVHALGVIHRDLKPGNIFLTAFEGYEDWVKILDFGIALLADRPRLTGKDLIVGTPEYIAPEQVFGRDIGPYSDIYALGGIAYEMLAGRPPFADASPTQLLVKQLNEMPAPVHEIVEGVPEGLGRIVMKMLQKNPEDRYGDAYVLLKDLEALRLADKGPGGPAATTGSGAGAPDPKATDIQTAGQDHKRWSDFIRSSRSRAGKMENAPKVLSDMEALAGRLKEIETEQAGLEVEIEGIERDTGETRARLRHALEELARELSDRRSSYLYVSLTVTELEAESASEEKNVRLLLDKIHREGSDHLTYRSMRACAEAGRKAEAWLAVHEKIRKQEPRKSDLHTQVSDLEFQILELRKRMETLDRERAEQKRVFEEKIKGLEKEKRAIKNKLGKISSLFDR